MRRYLWVWILMAGVMGGSAALFLHIPAAEAETAAQPAAPVIVIDAGHGGEDGGASGADGTLEKGLNLSVASSLADFLTVCGCDVRMTRTDDRLLYDLYDDLNDYKGRKKTYDLRNRLRLAEETQPAVFISIHMNKFPEEKYSGLQVYYGASRPESRTFAEAIRSYTQMYLQPENKRETKAATSSIYLLSRTTVPAVLVECGFLSNTQELARLKDPEYQRQLALVIGCAVMELVGASAP